MRYFLIGLPGSGKSHWGKIWANTMKMPYFDLDEIIENNEGQSITDIFKSEGEEYFRNLETFYLKKLINNYGTAVLSTGGGTPCFNDNMNLMNDKGITLFLNPQIEKIAERIWQPVDDNKRPLFSACNSLDKVQDTLIKLYQNRKAFYQRSKIEMNKWDENSLKGLK